MSGYLGKPLLQAFLVHGIQQVAQEHGPGIPGAERNDNKTVVSCSVKSGS